MGSHSPGRVQDLNQLGDGRDHVGVGPCGQPLMQVGWCVLRLEADHASAQVLPHREVQLPDVAGDGDALDRRLAIVDELAHQLAVLASTQVHLSSMHPRYLDRDGEVGFPRVLRAVDVEFELASLSPDQVCVDESGDL